MNKQILNIHLMDDTAKLPTKAHGEDAAFDLYADEPNELYYSPAQNLYNGMLIKPHNTVMIHTGLQMEIPTGYWGGIYARSGLATKQGLRPANCVGVIDSNYRGEIMVAIHNDTNDCQIIHRGDRIAQFMLHEVIPTEINVVDSVSDTDRGNGGFGSSGK